MTASEAPLAASDNVTVTGETKPGQNSEPDSLPREKRELLQKIATDYDTLSEPIYAATTEVIPAEDRAKLTLLNQEKVADLAAVLTPEELDTYHYLSSVSVPLRRR